VESKGPATSDARKGSNGAVTARRGKQEKTVKDESNGAMRRVRDWWDEVLKQARKK
jgi:hypothetical protein